MTIEPEHKGSRRTRRQTIWLLTGGLAIVAAACTSDGPEPEAAVSVAGTQSAEVAPQHSPSGDISFSSVYDLNQSGGAAAAQLRHGEVASSRDWPASLYATFNTPDGRAVCTAALVGPVAMLTAAHCVPDTGTVSFVLAGASYQTQCQRHPGYAAATDASADFALCKVERTVSGPPGFLFETVSTTGMDGLLDGKPVILSGYGCISDIAAENEIDGRYRIGFNSIDETSNSTSRRRGPVYYSPVQRNNLLTKDDPDLANLCPGDSGGPAFRATGTGYAQRRIIGVNSRVFYLDATRRNYGSSLISGTGGPDFRDWARAWADQNQVVVCGVRGSVNNCR